jgi:hypothetical protein
MNANTKQENFLRDLDTNVYKLIDSYRTLLKKGQINSSAGIHEEFPVGTATSSIVLTIKYLFENLFLFILDFSFSKFTRSDK